MSKEPENVMHMKQQKEGHFTIECDQPFIPLVVVNEVLKEVHKLYTTKLFDGVLDKLPEEHKNYTKYLEKRCIRLRRWNIFWYGIAIAALGYIFFIGGR